MATSVWLTFIFWWIIKPDITKTLLNNHIQFLSLIIIISLITIFYWKIMNVHLNIKAEIYLYPASISLALMSIITHYIAIKSPSQFDGVIYYFIDNESKFGGFRPYSSNVLEDIEKFAFFSKAALSAMPLLDFRPYLIHCHDWQTGLVPVYLKERFQGSDFFRGIKSVITIHNLFC